MGTLIGLLWFDVFRIRRRVAVENIRQSFPEWPERRVLSTARASVINMGITLVDFIDIAMVSRDDLENHVKFVGEEHLQRAVAEGKGVFLLGLHLSNGDFGIAALAAQGRPTYLISKRFSSGWLDDLWFRVRGRFGTQFISPRDSAYDILKALRQNGIVIFVLDQFMGPPLGVRTRFFGRDTGTAFGLALFAQKTGAPVLPCYTHRLSNGRYEVVFEKPVPFEDQGDKKRTLQFMTQRYTDKLQEIVEAYPEQWMWIHRRWKVFNEDT